jgi:hypothetical protein
MCLLNINLSFSISMVLDTVFSTRSLMSRDS